jgi:hypothetical protein
MTSYAGAGEDEEPHLFARLAGAGKVASGHGSPSGGAAAIGQAQLVGLRRLEVRRIEREEAPLRCRWPGLAKLRLPMRRVGVAVGSTKRRP